MQSQQNQHFKLIACNVMWRELCHFAATSRNRFNLQFLPCRQYVEKYGEDNAQYLSEGGRYDGSGR